MKIKDLRTTEPYSKVATRAKLCLEVEQRKLWAGGWVDRVLVLVKATLYSYRTKGESGSVNAWGVGGAEVGARRPRKDGRYIVIISRLQNYRIVFALNTLQEQACFLKALSTSGVTIVGLYGILIANEFEKTQNALKKSLEEIRTEEVESFVYLRNVENKNLQRSLAMPQLSNRMTEVNWTFQGTSIEDLKWGERNTSSSSNTTNNESKINSFDKENCQEKDISFEKTSRCRAHPKKEDSDEKISLPEDNLTKHDKPDNQISTSFLNDTKRQWEVKSSTQQTADEESLVYGNSPKTIPTEDDKVGSTMIIKDYFENDPYRPETSSPSNILLSSSKFPSTSSLITKFESLEKLDEPDSLKNHCERKKEIQKQRIERMPISEHTSGVDTLREPSTENNTKHDGSELKNEKQLISRNDEDTKNKKNKTVTRSALTPNKEVIENGLSTIRKKFSVTDLDFNDPETILSGDLKVSSQVGSRVKTQNVSLKRGKLLISSARNPEDGIGPNCPSSETVERIDLEAVSVIPVLGKNLSSLVLRKKNKCIKVLQLQTREEQLVWLHKICDEVMNVTPLTKRNSLTLYPTPHAHKERRSSKISTKDMARKVSREESFPLPFNLDNNPKEDVEKIAMDSSSASMASNQYPVENESQTKVKTLKRRLAIRRQSKETDKSLVPKNINNDFSDIIIPSKTICDSENKENDTVETLNMPLLSVSNHNHSASNKEKELSKDDFSDNGRIVEESLNDLSESLKAVSYSYINSRFNEGENDEAANTELFSKTQKILDDKTRRLGENETDKDCISMNDATNLKKQGFQDSHSEPTLASKEYSVINAPQPTNLHYRGESKVKNIIKNFNEISKAEHSEIKQSTGFKVGTSCTLQSKDNLWVSPNHTSSPFHAASLNAKTFPVVSRANEKTKQRNAPSLEVGEKKQSSSTLIKPISNTMEAKKILYFEGLNKGESDYFLRKEKSGASINVTWSVRTIKERFEILNTVNSNKGMNPFVREQNSITKRKKIRDSIRRKHVLEGEIRRASIKNESQRRVDIENHSNKEITMSDKSIKSTKHLSKGHRNSEIKEPFNRHSFNSKRSVIVAREDRFEHLCSSLPLIRPNSKEKRRGRRSKTVEVFRTQTPTYSSQIGHEDSLLESLNDTFLAKRCLVAREIELRKVQDALVRQEELIWSLHSQIEAMKVSDSHDGTNPMRSKAEPPELDSLKSALEKAKTENEKLEEKYEAVKHRAEIAKEKMKAKIIKSLE